MIISRQKTFWILLILHGGILVVMGLQYIFIHLPKDGQLNAYSFHLFFSIFYWAASTTFLALWENHRDIYNDIPDTYKVKWFNNKDFNDDTMLLVAAAIWFWQFKNAILFFEISERWSAILGSMCSTINSAIFLLVTTKFQFVKPAPWWTSHRALKDYFQQGKGIWKMAVITIISTNLLIWYGLGLVEVPDTIFSIIVAFFLFAGLSRLFGEREMNKLRFLIAVNCLLLIWALINSFCYNVKTDQVSLVDYVGVGYKMSLIALSFALVISYHSSLRKLFLFEKNLELDNKNKELNNKNLELLEKNLELDDKSEKLKFLRQEVSHRVKNHLQTLVSSLDRQLNKYSSNGASEAAMELQAVKARAIAILGIHELLYHPEPEDSDLYYIFLEKYFSELLSRLKDSFSYPPNCYNFQIELSEKIMAKASIVSQIGMLITELALNVDQHAYLNTEPKYLQISILQEKERLVIEITDQGKGINIEKEVSKKGQGLAIAKAIIDQFAGTLNLKSSASGTQATILFHLKNLQ